ncbi:phospholipase A [Flavobacterium sp. HSC-61S13]|uniref:phospholipase A n=1 Tax=Flavobacterium sp. HSC-61S13 TaxID=2910963 RepID=UPI0020A02281|nr:phospholipase A [Flavobacterium sp. HSC-61S13]MCP1994509.1 phospholipase A1 [Flavobacterium sp. HSC-61S13]
MLKNVNKTIQHSLLVLSTVFLSQTVFSQDGKGGLFDGETQARTLTERWELSSETKKGTFVITPYKPIYVSPLRWSSDPNKLPTSDSPDNNALIPQDYNSVESRFQLSFKTKVMQGIFWGAGDIWLAFTQTANWQVYNADLSRPFRELNYEPEVILNFATNFEVFGVTNRMMGISLNHQSNGKSLPGSRSWNRVIFQTAFDYKDLSVIIRPWIRMHEKIEEDDNPGIEEYVGRGDITLIYKYKEQEFSLLARNNMRFNKRNKGYLEMNWTYPISGNLKAHLQVANGYGDTMIDFNHKQTIIGLGVSLIEWL